ncbi:MAG: nif-specific transcriptional activator NifA [Thermodesulfobacteriota bacterium]
MASNTHKTGKTDHLEVQALYQIAQLVGSALDLDKALAEILRAMHEILRMERATLVLADESGKRLAIRASYGLTRAEQSRGIYQSGEGIIGKIYESRYPCVVPDIHREPLFLNRTGARSHLPKGEISFIGVPVMLSDRVVGVLTADRLFGPEVSFEEDVRFLTVVATLIGQFLNLHQAISQKERVLLEENVTLKAELRYRYSHHGIIGQSKATQEVFRAIDKVAPSRATVLLLGESGTGKELVARAIHEAGSRHDHPFIKVNCAALPENLLESELLGHEKGAFTGALGMKKGRFELADGGTLFLDEIGEMPITLQAKLLRVLQERQFERLGGSRTITVDVRVIAATNRSLEAAVAEGTFRPDLYYRLNVVPLLLPPLRDRREDVPLLLDHFLRESNRNNQREVRLSRAVLRFFEEYNWPGNVREMQNLIERLVIMADREWIEINSLPSYMMEAPSAAPDNERRHGGAGTSTLNGRPESFPAEDGGSGRRLLDLEKEEIVAALRRNGWVQARAARELGLTQRQIGYKMRKYGLERPRF